MPQLHDVNLSRRCFAVNRCARQILPGGGAAPGRARVAARSGKGRAGTASSLAAARFRRIRKPRSKARKATPGTPGPAPLSRGAATWRSPRRRQRPAGASVPPADGEGFLTALYAARRYVWNAPGVRRVLLRTAPFIPGAAAVWSLLPLVAGDSLGLGSGGYGPLLAAVGYGAVGGAFLLPGTTPEATHAFDAAAVAGRGRRPPAPPPPAPDASPASGAGQDG
ncbi:MFS transporter [Streptomyces sp. NPDC058464]|uniref:MFS transporter n=1 Tax=Streptomyces sp. NPDC058464 TaxID=3346511 RepID=UPI00364B8ED5